jgi:CRP-like cAMP-binding protein
MGAESSTAHTGGIRPWPIQNRKIPESGDNMRTENHLGLRTGTELEQFIADHPFFNGMSAERIAEVVRDAREVIFQAGEVIFHENDPADRFFLIKEGEVALESHVPGDGLVFVETIGPRDVLGWSWLVPPYLWQFAARAVTRTKATALNGAHLLGVCERDPAFGYDLMKRITRIILARLQATRKRLLEISPRQR